MFGVIAIQVDEVNIVRARGILKDKEPKVGGQESGQGQKRQTGGCC